jgi:hypothetical protein
MTHIRQSGLDAGLGFQVESLFKKTSGGLFAREQYRDFLNLRRTCKNVERFRGGLVCKAVMVRLMDCCISQL